jgi:FkbM family methyltransferase
MELTKKYKGSLERWKRMMAVARSRGASLSDQMRLFHLGVLKRSLVHRGLGRHRAENIHHFAIRGPDKKNLTMYLRDNSLDVETFFEFFAFKPEMLPSELPNYQPKVIYDIGANVGMAALYFMCVYPQAQILAFEPVPANYEICALNLSNSPEAKSYPWAIGAATGTATFEFDQKDLRGGRLGRLEGKKASSLQKIEVPVFSLRDVIEKRGCPAPDFLKIDVEGAEMDVLKGLGTEPAHAKIMLIETHGPAVELAVLKWLADHRFTLRHQHEAAKGFSTIWAERL